MRIVLAEINCATCGVRARIGASIYPSGSGKVSFCPMCRAELPASEVRYDEPRKTTPTGA